MYTLISQVANYTYTCYHAGQEIAIRIIQNEWLHKGALICPPCRDICQVTTSYLNIRREFFFYHNYAVGYHARLINVCVMQAELMARGDRCKPGDEHPPSTFYHRDNLVCSSAPPRLLLSTTHSIVILYQLLLLIIFCR